MRTVFRKNLLVLLVLFTCFQTSVIAGGFDVAGPEPIPVKKKPTPNPNVPRSRERYEIEESPVCQYFYSEVTIMADSTITYISAQVVRMDDNVSWSNAGAGDTLVIQVTDEPGTYILTFTLSNGDSYYGEYTLY